MAKLVLRGFGKLKRLLNPSGFQRRLQRNVRAATKQNVLQSQAAVVGAIRGRKVEGGPNSPATIAIKGSSTPLADEGQLVKAIHHRVPRWTTGKVGVLKDVQVHDKDTGRRVSLHEIAGVLQAGATIKVTEKMRLFFFAMARQFPERYKPLSPSTRVIVIPARPFIEHAVSPALNLRAADNWTRAVDLTMIGK